MIPHSSGPESLVSTQRFPVREEMTMSIDIHLKKSQIKAFLRSDDSSTPTPTPDSDGNHNTTAPSVTQ